MLEMASHGARYHDEVARGEVGALVQPLVERVLPRRLGAAPDHGAGLEIHRDAVAIDALAIGLHLQLLQVGRQARKARGIAQHRVAGRAERVAVPDADEAQQRRHVALQRIGAELQVGGVRPGKELLEAVHADRDRHRQAHARPEREAPADPVGEREHVALRQSPLAGFLVIGARGDDVLRDGIGAECRHDPVARRRGIHHGLLRGEGLGSHHHQRGGGVQPRHGVVELRGVDVGHEAHLGPIGVGAQRLDGKLRPERRAADAERQHVGEFRPGGALPLAVAHRLREDPHALAVALDLGAHIVPVHRRALVAAQRRMQRGAVLGGVHALAGEQALGGRGQSAIARERHQESERLGGDALLGKIRGDAGAGEGQRGTPPGILLPHLGDAPARERIAVRKQRVPGRGRREGRHRERLRRVANSNPAPTPRCRAPCRWRRWRGARGRPRAAGARP